MTIKEIKLGELVKLNSGSPALTVDFINQDTNEVTVKWFDEHGNPRETYFDVACLTKITE